jgi:hypothetical protein
MVLGYIGFLIPFLLIVIGIAVGSN